MRWDFPGENFRKFKLVEEEIMQRRHNLEAEEMQRRHNLERKSLQEWFRRYVLSGHDVATESGKQEVLKAWDTCVRDGDVATARVGSGKEEAEKEGARAPSLFFFFANFRGWSIPRKPRDSVWPYGRWLGPFGKVETTTWKDRIKYRSGLNFDTTPTNIHMDGLSYRSGTHKYQDCGHYHTLAFDTWSLVLK